jgi:hypothetical protein
MYPQDDDPSLWTTIVDNQRENLRHLFLPHTRWIGFSLLNSLKLSAGRSSPQVCPQGAHNLTGVFAHVVHTSSTGQVGDLRAEPENDRGFG